MDLIVAIVVALLLTWALLLLLLWAVRPRNVSARELLGLVPDLIRLLRSVLADRTVPLDVKLVLVGLLIWIISPIDLIPEFIPGLGAVDDVIVAVLALRFTRRRLGIGGLRARWSGTQDGFRLVERVIG